MYSSQTSVQSNPEPDTEEDRSDAPAAIWQGYMPDGSCVDHIITLRTILEQVNEFQESIYLGFMKYEKASIGSSTKICGMP